MSELRAGDKIDFRYTLGMRVGVGGFAEVWNAKDELLSRTVAIKILTAELKSIPGIVDDFKREYTGFQDYRHPNIIAARHYGEHQGTPYLVMEYCEAGSLDGLRSAKLTTGSLPKTGSNQFLFKEREIVTLLYDTANGLAYLHQRHILHGDVKPANILLSGNGTFVLTDFGISKHIRHKISKASLTPKDTGKGQKQAHGTEAYQPPELFWENPAQSDRSDIFSLGVTVYEMVTNQIPWNAEGGGKLLNGAKVPDLWLVTEKARNQSQFQISEQLCHLITACMAPDPQDRPRAADLCYVLARLFPNYLQSKDDSNATSVDTSDGERFQAKVSDAKHLLAQGKYRQARDRFRVALEVIRLNKDAIQGWEQSRRLLLARAAFWASVVAVGSAAGIVLVKLFAG